MKAWLKNYFSLWIGRGIGGKYSYIGCILNNNISSHYIKGPVDLKQPHSVAVKV